MTTDTRRREALKSLGLGALGAAAAAALPQFASFLPPRAFAGTVPFPASPCKGTHDTLDLDLKVISGALPADARGHVFLVEALDTPSRDNLVAGDGAIARVDLEEGRARLRKTLISTASVLAGRALEGTRFGFKTHALARFAMNGLGVCNPCNTAVAPLGNGRLALTYDGGVPHEIDPVTLEVVTPIGARDEWRQGMPPISRFLVARDWIFPMIRSTAHPYHDARTGEFITVNHGGLVNFAGLEQGAGFLNVVVWDGEGALRSFEVVDERGRPLRIPTAVHSLCVTRDHVIAVDTPLSVEGEVMIGLDALRPQSDSTTLWIVKRADLAGPGGKGKKVLGRKVVLAKEWEHIVADYDDAGGVVTIHGASSPATDFSECLKRGDKRRIDGKPVREDLLGMIPAPMDVGDCGRFRIRVGETTAALLPEETRLVSDRRLTWHLAIMTWNAPAVERAGRFEQIYFAAFGFSPELLPERIYDLYERYRYRNVPVRELPWEGVPPALFRLDTTTMAIADSYSMPPGHFLSSPQFVPRAGAADGGGQTEGYVMCVVTSDRAGGSSSGDELWIFDAANLAAGPVCVLGSPELDFAFTIHSHWMPTIARRTAAYRIDQRADLAPALERAPREVREAFERHVFPTFE